MSADAVWSVAFTATTLNAYAVPFARMYLFPNTRREDIKNIFNTAFVVPATKVILDTVIRILRSDTRTYDREGQEPLRKVQQSIHVDRIEMTRIDGSYKHGGVARRAASEFLESLANSLRTANEAPYTLVFPVLYITPRISTKLGKGAFADYSAPRYLFEESIPGNDNKKRRLRNWMEHGGFLRNGVEHKPVCAVCDNAISHLAGACVFGSNMCLKSMLSSDLSNYKANIAEYDKWVRELEEPELATRDDEDEAEGAANGVPHK